MCNQFVIYLRTCHGVISFGIDYVYVSDVLLCKAEGVNWVYNVKLSVSWRPMFNLYDTCNCRIEQSSGYVAPQMEPGWVE